MFSSTTTSTTFTKCSFTNGGAVSISAILSLLILLVASPTLVFCSTSDELRALLEFKKGIHGDPLGKITNSWSHNSAISTTSDLDSCPSTFFGVTCDVNSNSVSAVVLDRLNLTGELKFSTLIALKMLRKLSLVGNSFTGRLVPQLGTISSLEHLDLSENQFIGSIPDRIHDLWGLQYLNLSNNQFTGGYPSGIRNLQQLRVLDMHSNRLWGDVGDFFSELRNVEFVDLSCNKFSGELPGDPMNISTLGNTVKHLNLSRNSLGGKFLRNDTLALFKSLEVLDFGYNRIGGELPPFGMLLNLKVLRLGNNQLFGEIPRELLVTSIPLRELDLSGNGFSGSLDVINSTTMKNLNLSANRLTGHIPDSLANINGLETLDLSKNQLEGHLPENLPLSLKALNVAGNDLSGSVPESLRNFPPSSFRPGNEKLVIPGVDGSHNGGSRYLPSGGEPHGSRAGVKVAIILASIGAALMIAFVSLAYYRAHNHGFYGRKGFDNTSAGTDVKLGKFARPSLFNFHAGSEPSQSSMSYSNDLLLTSNSRCLSGEAVIVPGMAEHTTEVVRSGSSHNKPNHHDNAIVTSARKSPPGSPLVEALEQPVTLEVYSPDRFAGELFFLDPSLSFTAEQLSRAPAEVLGRSSHGTLYKATLADELMLAVKWLRVGLVKHKKEFAKEVKKIGSLRHPNLIPVRAYYWGPREQERLVLSDYVHGESLAIHLYESTPRRYSRLSFTQRLKVAIDVARCLVYLHERGMVHGNLKPSNILLSGPNFDVRVSDFCLHRLMTPNGISEHILNLGALGYSAPELSNTSKPSPTFKADVYALGVIIMELVTRRSAGDIISGQSGAVDLTDWVRLCDREGRRTDCIDGDITSGEEPSKEMDDLLGIAIRCVLPVNERPNIQEVFQDLCSLSG